MSEFKMRSRKNETQTADFSLEKLERPDNEQLFEFFESKVEDILPAKTSPAVFELLYRHHLMLMDEHVHARLETLFSDPPDDMTERLEKACGHLGITGEHAELYATAAENWAALEQLGERIEVGAWSISNLETLKGYVTRARSGAPEALPPVIAYVQHETVRRELLPA